MYRLLIVDNEPFIVESVLDLFERRAIPELELLCAYSSAEALRCMQTVKIDIVLTDIRMPGMSGLELHREIMKYWPRCKVIFLTGYNDFDYIHEAIRNGGVDYLLKTEGDEAIVASVQKALTALSEAVAIEEYIAKSKQQMQAITPLLQKELLWELVQGDSSVHGVLSQSFEEVGIELAPSEPVVAMIGRVDDWKEGTRPFDKSLYLFAIQNIAQEYVSAKVQVLSFDFEKKTKLLWLMQPNERTEGLSAAEVTGLRQRCLVFLKGAAEMIQDSCSVLLKLNLSMAIGASFKEWDQLSEQFEHLQQLLNRGLGLGQQQLLIEQTIDIASAEQLEHDQRKQLKKLNLLHTLLENGQKAPFMTEYAGIMKVLTERSAANNSIKTEVYFTLVSIFLSYINRWEIQHEVGSRFNLGKMTILDCHNNWKEVVDYFYRLAEALFEHKQAGKGSQENDVIRMVQRYVQQNLAGDLTLNRIGDVVGHNPSYLSRLYKQVTNEGLSDYIMTARLEKAKELLEENRLKIHEISASVGFLSEQSFYRFFRKALQMTPQEYRESVVTSRNASAK
ncbi:response regulator transcription factor [Paenibacillus montanisoli]|uniref:DNA-binding response regulator n=1 Tax=Paenibacillus montanisoli TaxID=2081970 RepID=A0A328TZ21_9BACL|nr:response regulator [Paenibacillus montanisoli]RAP74763.1 DNA-binding response regulator [Paenibacillus montanisoli]